MSSDAGGRKRRASAGRRGETIRSDVWVEIERSDSGGIRLELTSRVEPYFGDSLRSQIGDVLEAAGIENASVVVDDSGALPFVIAARLEAAARAAGVEADRDLGPAPTVRSRRPAPRDSLRRSRLYLPGNEPKYFVNAGLYRPDAVILDLEDSVHAEAKDAARILVRNALRTVDFGRAERMVRINQLPLGLEDLEVLAPEGPDLILVPKVERPEQIEQVDSALRQMSPGGSADGPPWLMPIVESSLGIENAFAIASASERIAALTIGLEDYAADLGVAKSREGAESSWARARLVNAAKAAGVQAIDSVYGQVDDLDGLAEWCAASSQLGFEGMGCLHPRQIPVIHRGFDPTPEQVHRAVRIVEAFRDAQDRGLGVVSLGSKMIDPPVVEQALRLVERARAVGLLDDETASPEASPS